jgi:predicted TIM-barrel fold metal-dependent hydrolase
MPIFDCHFHIESGTERYNIEAAGRNIIFNSFDSYHKNNGLASKDDSITIIFDYRNHFDEVKTLLVNKEVAALKIHNRVQKIGAPDYAVLVSMLEEVAPTVPIVIDAFYYGDDLEFQPNLGNIIQIAKKFPGIPIIVAHCGGIEILKYFYHLKPLSNIYFDLSFSLAYLKNTSVYADYKNLLKYGNHDQILFGTDYPFIDARAQLSTFRDLADEASLKKSVVDKVLFDNAQSLFKRRQL